MTPLLSSDFENHTSPVGGGHEGEVTGVVVTWLVSPDYLNQLTGFGN
jgi:hypothetical protein